MISTDLYTQLYLNTSLLQDLASNLIGGYYTNKSFRDLSDEYILGRISELKRRQNTEDAKTSPIPINFRTASKVDALTKCNNISQFQKCCKDNIVKETDNSLVPKELNLNIVYDETLLNYNEWLKSLDNRVNRASEESTVKTYTLFSFYNTILNVMSDLKLFKIIDKRTKTLDGLCAGEYVLICGTLKINTLYNYVENLISILKAYGTNNLDSLFNNSSIGPITYTSMVNLLLTLQASLIKDNSSIAIIQTGNTNAILILNNTYIAPSSLLYNSNNSPVISLGKATKVINSSDKYINTLNKTGLSDYYTKLLNSFIPYLNILNENGFYIPTEYISSIKGPALTIIPVSIYI